MHNCIKREGSVYGGSWASIPHAGGGGYVFLDYPFEHQFEFTYIKRNNRQMTFANVRSENIGRRDNHR